MADADRVRSKLGEIEQYVNGLRAKQDCTLEEYSRDRDLRDIVERRFEKAIQASIDLASHVVSAEGFREPRDYGDLFAVLAEADVLEPRTADSMTEMAGFRNVLVHEYAEIHDERVWEHLQDLGRFDQFATEIYAFIAD